MRPGPGFGQGPTADPLGGFYGPGSQMWRINREAVLLGAGPAALLLQIAHPLVAEGVSTHSTFQADPFGRLRRTLRTTLDMIFGDGATAERAIRRLNGVHAGVRGQVRDPGAREASGARSYRALDPSLLLWVQGSLVIMSIRAYQAWVADVSAAEREQLWQEARAVGTRLGIPLELSPTDWPALEAWFEDMLRPGGPIVVTSTARALAPAILRPPVPLIPVRLMDLAALPGLALLPERVRDGFGIGWSALDERLARASALALRSWVRAIPADWRAMPPARSAARRMQRVE